jgi:rod shape-determining protein MreD
LKKVIINIVLVLTAFILYFLQSNFFSWFNIAGIMPNLFVILILLIGLFANRTMGTIYGVAVGLILDFIIGTKIGICGVGLGLIGFLAGVFDKNFSKDSRMTIMFMVLTSTIVFEVLKVVLNYIFLSSQIEVMSFVVILVIEVVFNLLLTIIFYPLLQ